MDRRRFLLGSSLLALGAAAGWEVVARRIAAGDDREDFDAGPVAHVLPSATHGRLRVKVSFRSARRSAPALLVDDARIEGAAADTRGRFWIFDADDLQPASEHTLRVVDTDGTALTAPWPLSTLPAPDAEVSRLRLLLYTCAGGPAYIPSPTMGSAYLPVAVRRRLLRRALDFDPDVAIANGDHVYWDLGGKNGWALGNSAQARWRAGLFDRGQPVLGTGNETVLTRAFDPQIADLYGTSFRSVPVVFVQDDHDYMNNDDLLDEGSGTFPASDFTRELARATQRLYYPEFLPTASMPEALLGDGRVSPHHGALRVGRLFEGLVYDCRGELRLGDDGSFLRPETEGWLTDRLRGSDARWVAQMPSAPFGWSAGKWLEWYPDTLGDDGRLHVDAEKPGWSQAWLAQHDRLLAAAAARDDRVPLLLGGDIHASGAGYLRRSGEVDLRPNPAIALLVGALGTGTGWPSYFRGTEARPSGVLEMEELLEPIERNGFTILDVTPDGVTARLFLWSPAEGVEAIDALEPAHTFDFAARGGAV